MVLEVADELLVEYVNLNINKYFLRFDQTDIYRKNVKKYISQHTNEVKLYITPLNQYIIHTQNQ